MKKTRRWKRTVFYLMVAAIKLVTLPVARSIRGAHRLPPGSYVIAANHRSLIDGILLTNEFNRIRGRPIRTIAYRDPFSHWLFGPILRLSGCIPFDRGDPESRFAVVRRALGHLRIGDPVALFPEGHLNKTGTLRRARPGAALLALESGAPVVPVGIRGSELVLEPGSQRFRLRRAITIEIGFPLDFSSLQATFQAGDATARAGAVEAATAEIMRSIAVLSGQQYRPPRTRRRGEGK